MWLPEVPGVLLHMAVPVNLRLGLPLPTMLERRSPKRVGPPVRALAQPPRPAHLLPPQVADRWRAVWLPVFEATSLTSWGGRSACS